MKAAALIALALVTATPALADTITQTFDLDYIFDPNDKDFSPPTATFNTFDTMGGTRELVGVTFSSHINAGMDVTVQNWDATPYAAGTWSCEIVGSILAFFQENNGVFGPSTGLGGLFIEGLTGDLGAGDGVGFPFGNPSEIVVTASVQDTINSSTSFGSDTFDYFSAGGSFDILMPTFSEFLLTPPDKGGFGIFGGPSGGYQNGTLTLTYQYRNVPTPAGASLLAVGALGAARRR